MVILKPVKSKKQILYQNGSFGMKREIVRFFFVSVNKTYVYKKLSTFTVEQNKTVPIIWTQDYFSKGKLRCKCPKFCENDSFLWKLWSLIFSPHSQFQHLHASSTHHFLFRKLHLHLSQLRLTFKWLSDQLKLNFKETKWCFIFSFDTQKKF